MTFYKVIEILNHTGKRRIWRRVYKSRDNALRDIKITPDVKKTLIVPIGHTLLRRN